MPKDSLPMTCKLVEAVNQIKILLSFCLFIYHQKGKFYRAKESLLVNDENLAAARKIASRKTCACEW